MKRPEYHEAREEWDGSAFDLGKPEAAVRDAFARGLDLEEKAVEFCLKAAGCDESHEWIDEAAALRWFSIIRTVLVETAARMGADARASG
jgi:hypothetical protein